MPTEGFRFLAADVAPRLEQALWRHLERAGEGDEGDERHVVAAPLDAGNERAIEPAR